MHLSQLGGPVVIPLQHVLTRGICAKGRIMSTPDEQRFLSSRPREEEVTAFDLPVTGQVPDGLNGRYLRNGPNPLGLDDPSYHWFVGVGLVHGVRLREGKAEWYRNRWVRSKAVAEQLHEKWPRGPVHEDMDFAANTCIISHGGRTLATVEAGALPYEVTDELDTVGPCDFDGTLRGVSPPTPSSTTPLVSCTPSPTSGPGTTSSTSSSTRAERSPAPPTPRPRRADDARLRAHRPLRGPAGPAGHVQLEGGHQRHRTAVRVEPPTRPGSACSPGTEARPCAGSRSSPAGCSPA